MKRALVLLLAACSAPGLGVTAARDAQHDLRCPYEQIESYRTEKGTMVARGCGHWAEYDCESVPDSSGSRQTTCHRIAVH